MAYRRPFVPTNTAPFAPADYLARIMAAKYRVDEETGCWHWHGAILTNGRAKTQYDGQMRITDANGKAHCLSAIRVAQFVAGHGWPKPKTTMKRLCKSRCCVAPAHHVAIDVGKPQLLSDEQIEEIRDLWHKRRETLAAVVGKKEVPSRLPSAESLTSKETWLSYETLRRYREGLPLKTSQWSTQEVSVDELGRIYAKNAAKSTHIAQIAASVADYSMAALAKRYGVSRHTIQRVIYS